MSAPFSDPAVAQTAVHSSSLISAHARRAARSAKAPASNGVGSKAAAINPLAQRKRKREDPQAATGPRAKKATDSRAWAYSQLRPTHPTWNEGGLRLVPSHTSVLHNNRAAQTSCVRKQERKDGWPAHPNTHRNGWLAS